jgi:hypothetical protein
MSEYRLLKKDCFMEITETWYPKQNIEHKLTLSENPFFKIIFGVKTEKMVVN